MVSMIRLIRLYYMIYGGPKGLKATIPLVMGMNRKTIENNNDINHDDCFNNHERCLI